MLVNAILKSAKNVVFDIGCVLLTFEPETYLPLTVSAELAERLDWHLLYDSPMWVALDGGTVTEEEVARDTARRFGDESVWPQIMPAIQRFPEFMRPMPACELIPQLHAQGKKVFALSNYGLEPFARTEKRFSALFSQMDGMVISGRERVSKPDAAIYQLLCSRYGLTPAECVFIDDRPVNVEAARRVGMQGILYTGIESLL